MARRPHTLTLLGHDQTTLALSNDVDRARDAADDARLCARSGHTVSLLTRVRTALPARPCLQR